MPHALHFHDYVNCRKLMTNAGRIAERLNAVHGSAIDFGPFKGLTDDMCSWFLLDEINYRGLLLDARCSSDEWLQAINRCTGEASIESAKELEKSLGRESTQSQLAIKSLVMNAVSNLTNGEIGWREAGRPFYNCYAIVFDFVRAVKLQVAWSQLRVPCGGQLLFRFPKGSEPHGMSTLLVGDVTEADGDRLISFAVTFAGRELSLGERCSELFAFRVSPAESSVTVEEKSELWVHSTGNRSVVRGDEEFHERAYVQFALRLVAFAALVNDDPQMLTPVVLSKDQNAFDASTDEALRDRLVERARRINGRGFDFGKSFEELRREHGTSPHWRNPHPALVWTGKGRTTPRIVFRSGALVSAGELFSLPTGYMGVESADELAGILGEAPNGPSEYVYLLRDGVRPYVKVGMTRRDVQARLKELSTANRQLRLIGIIRTGDAACKEAEIHRELAAVHRDGEFFWLSQAGAKEIVVRHGGHWLGED